MPQPPETPAPITPEGRRAADKIRNLFACIVAANIALVAVVVWQGYFGKRGGSRSEEAASIIEGLVERSITSYNARDTPAFSALFTTGTRSDAAARHADYRRDFGRILAKQLISQPKAAIGDGSAVVHEITCEKEPHARLITKFTREKDAMKLAEWNIERP